MPKSKNLIQINEEQSSPQTICIDFGTTRSLVASTDSNGTPYILEDHIGPLDIPTTLDYKDPLTPPSCGLSKEDSVSSIKRLIDQPPDTIQNLGFTASKTKNGHWGIQTNIGPLQVYSIIQDFFQYLFKRTENLLKNQFSPEVIISVPAYFTQKAKSEVRLAATQAGWKPLRLLSEPTAAAFSYNLHKSEGLYLVYDWGGGTFDASLVESSGGMLLVQALAGDNLLGGDDLDSLIAQHYGPSNVPWPELMTEAQRCKEILGRGQTCLFYNTELTPENTYHVIKPLIDKTLQICDQMLSEANVSYSDLKSIVCVGGSSQHQSTLLSLKNHTQKNILNTVHPQKAVALGGAIYGHHVRMRTSLSLIDALPLSIGLELQGGLMEVMIPRNTPVPFQVMQKFTTSLDGQKFVKINVFQGERDFVKNCALIGELSLGPIPEMRAGFPQIEVVFSLDTEGLLHIIAVEKISETVLSTTLNHDFSKVDPSQVVLESARFALEDAEKYHYSLLVQKANLLIKNVNLIKDNSKAKEHANLLQKNMASLSRDDLIASIITLEELCLSSEEN